VCVVFCGLVVVVVVIVVVVVVVVVVVGGGGGGCCHCHHHRVHVGLQGPRGPQGVVVAWCCCTFSRRPVRP